MICVCVWVCIQSRCITQTIRIKENSVQIRLLWAAPCKKRFGFWYCCCCCENGRENNGKKRTNQAKIGQKNLANNRTFLLNVSQALGIASFIIIFSGHFTKMKCVWKSALVCVFFLSLRSSRGSKTLLHKIDLDLYGYCKHSVSLALSTLLLLLQCFFDCVSPNQGIVFLLYSEKKMAPATYGSYTRYDIPNKTDICVEFEMFK